MLIKLVVLDVFSVQGVPGTLPSASMPFWHLLLGLVAGMTQRLSDDLANEHYVSTGETRIESAKIMVLGS